MVAMANRSCGSIRGLIPWSRGSIRKMQKQPPAQLGGRAGEPQCTWVVFKNTGEGVRLSWPHAQATMQVRSTLFAASCAIFSRSHTDKFRLGTVELFGNGIKAPSKADFFTGTSTGDL